MLKGLALISRVPSLSKRKVWLAIGAWAYMLLDIGYGKSGQEADREL